jgi:hypothetical protein
VYWLMWPFRASSESLSNHVNSSPASTGPKHSVSPELLVMAFTLKSVGV